MICPQSSILLIHTLVSLLHRWARSGRQAHAPWSVTDPQRPFESVSPSISIDFIDMFGPVPFGNVLQANHPYRQVGHSNVHVTGPPSFRQQRTCVTVKHKSPSCPPASLEIPIISSGRCRSLPERARPSYRAR
ncbi:hypothetical protein BDU57DRAFT_517314 [Ampelomyces quisqualis]|uniref:Secreted protein n=1 Tax=Ampelomyces quisqualis TaxID=50730 RepID=A0A6A5QNG9_AMPQU|nr:hypothetical protein BDU57DRAFT_517314 [Ampelomyces quisqualis]